jgi:hypothetical protein
MEFRTRLDLARNGVLDFVVAGNNGQPGKKLPEGFPRDRTTK